MVFLCSYLLLPCLISLIHYLLVQYLLESVLGVLIIQIQIQKRQCIHQSGTVAEAP